MIRAATSKRAGPHLSLNFKDLVPYILRGLQSPLCAHSLSQLYLQIRESAFNHCVWPNQIPVEPTLQELIAHITLRLQRPKCDLDSAWDDEHLGW